MRALIIAGHIGIESLTNDLLPDADVAELRRGTGARGEREWTGAFAGLLRDALAQAGVEARATDCTYSAALYATWRPEVVLNCHLHRDDDGGPGGAHAAFAVPDPFLALGDLWESARLLDRLMGAYTQRTGILVTQRIVTTRMTQNYLWSFLPPGAAAVIAEFGNLNDAGDRTVLYEPAIQRIVTYVRDCVMEHGDLPLPGEEPLRRRAADVAPAPQPADSADLVAADLERIVARVRKL